MRKETVLLLLIVGLAGLLRFYQLGKVPAGFFNDEAAVGYNAYSLLQTGKDEFGKPWPFLFRSFGEGKLPLYIYQALPSVAVFGLNEFASRFPGAFFGTLAVMITYFFVKEVLLFSLGKPKKKSDKFLLKWLPFWSAFVLAVMPWHVHFSRGVFGQESLFWMILGAWLSIKAVKKQRLLFWLGSFLAFSCGLLTYHSPRVFVPLWILYILLYLAKDRGWLSAARVAILAVAVTGSVWLAITLSPLGIARAGGVSVFSEHSGVKANLSTRLIESKELPIWLTRAFHNKVEAYGRDIIWRYFSHFDPAFLFFSGDPLRPRYRVPNLGQLMLISLPFFLAGLYFLIKKKIWPILVFLLIAPLPAALSFETPSSVRAIFMIIPLAVIIALGLNQWLYWLKERKVFLKIVIATFVLGGFVYNLASYLDAYYIHAPAFQPYYWQYGYKSLVNQINQLGPKYERVEITDKRGTPYIFFLFYNQYDPEAWQVQVNENIEKEKAFNFIAIRKMDKLIFSDETCPAKEPEDNVLYVCTEENHPQKLIKAGVVRRIKTIPYQDGQPAFVLMEKVEGMEIPETLFENE